MKIGGKWEKVRGKCGGKGKEMGENGGGSEN